ncbi:hypothetical protein [Cytophaga aurantiaca]|uniref:hypothetical protein n=1 Tax=Cytophaga aurantiaca TaxID=29530 RepID=UPI0003764691|nr:hypothetical protein [Cytophaga aurantiaca]
MAEAINPGNWKDIFSDTLYIINDPNAIAATPVQAASTTSVEMPKAVEAPKETVVTTATPSIPKSPSIPASPSLTAVKEEISSKAPEAPALKPTGKYSNGILILMHVSYSMTSAQQEMLGKIVKAVQLDYNDCGVLLVSTPVSLTHIETLKPRIILSFGLPTDAFTPRLSKDLYAIQKHNNTIILLADALAKLETTVALKASLWNAMKEMFGIK